MAAQTYQVGQIYFFVVAQLVRSKLFNVRRIKGGQLSAKEQAAIEKLAALILAKGLLQNLIGFLPKKSKGGAVVEIVAGGRRLAAINWLISNGKLPADFPVEVRICTIKEATAISLAENSEREALPPADQFRAFQLLADEGHSAAEIATTWGVDEITIKRRLKLANVSPRLFALYEDENATLDQLMALALTDDHTTQERVWDSLADYQRTHHAIRNLITTQEISVLNNRTAKFVGIAEYEEAGGEVRRDLFSNLGEGYLKDAALLESLAVAKLERLCSNLIKGQWAWIDFVTNIDHEELKKFMRCDTVLAEFSEEDQAVYDALVLEKEALEKIESDLANGIETEQTEEEVIKGLDDIDQKMNALEMAYCTPASDMAKMAGMIVTIGHNGKVLMHHGLVSPEHKHAMKALQAASDVAAGNPAPPPPPPAEKTGHSEKLIRQLTAHRTAALQFMVAERTPVALVVLAHKLALAVFDFGRLYHREESVAQIRLTSTNLKNESEEITANSPALEKFGQLHLAWQDRLPTDIKQLFQWLLEQEQAVVLDLLAYCTAYSLDTLQSDESVNGPAQEISKAVNLDMADWWQPTRTSYFSQVSKQHIIAIVAAEKNAEVAKPLGDMKKIPLTETAEQLMTGTRWLPQILKTAP